MIRRFRPTNIVLSWVVSTIKINFYGANSNIRHEVFVAANFLKKKNTIMQYSHILQIDFVISPAFWKLHTITYAFSTVVYFPLLNNKVEIEAKYGNSIRHYVNIWMTLKELLPTYSITVKPFYGTIWCTGLIGSYQSCSVVSAKLNSFPR
jgi:hypothetical protein